MSAKEAASLLQKVVQTSRRGLTEKQVTLDLAQLAFNEVSRPWYCKVAFPAGDIALADFMAQPLNHYEQDRDAWEVLQALYAAYVDLVMSCPPFTDIFGLLGYETKGLSRALGQFLTPPCVAKGALKFLGQPEDTKLLAGEPILMSDFGGCGAGSLILAYLSDIHSRHPERMGQVHVFGVDIDQGMVRLTSLQVLIACLYHRIALGSLRTFHAHAIIDYRRMNEKLAFVFGSDKGKIREFF